MVARKSPLELTYAKKGKGGEKEREQERVHGLSELNKGKNKTRGRLDLQAIRS